MPKLKEELIVTCPTYLPHPMPIHLHGVLLEMPVPAHDPSWPSPQSQTLIPERSGPFAMAQLCKAWYSIFIDVFGLNK